MKRYDGTAAMIVIVTAFFFSSTVLAQQQGSKDQKPINLQGKWDDGGDVVNITQNGTAVTAKWEKTSTCKHGETEDSYQSEFTATLEGNKLTKGRATYCSYGDASQRGKVWGDIDLTIKPDGTLSAVLYMKNSRGGVEEAPFDLTRVTRDCTSLRRGYDQAKALLDTHDAQSEAIAKQYNALYGKLAGMQGEAKRLRVNADKEWNEYVWNKWSEANIEILMEAFPDPVPDFSVPFVTTAADSVFNFYKFYRASQGSINDLRAWARTQPLGSTDDMLRLLNYLDSMGELAGQMSKLRNAYEDKKEHREALELAANDAKARLQECLAGKQ